MRQPITPMPCKPWALSGLSEKLITSHYEHYYGAAVRSLNALRAELETLDLAAAPGYQVLALKREELAAAGSVALHELYFGGLGGDGAALFTGSGAGSKFPSSLSGPLEHQFGSVAAWRREFVAAARALNGASGWVVLCYARRDGRLYNHMALDHSQTMIDAAPVLALDMYEHAYHLDFGANVGAYVDAFMRNIDWTAVAGRLTDASGDGSAARRVVTDDPLPSVSVEELSASLERSDRIQVLDARPRHYFSFSADMMRGASWRDPDRVDEWSRGLSAETPVVVYCAYGFHVGCGVAAALRERGFDAKYLRGGLAAWYAAGGERALKPRNDA